MTQGSSTSHTSPYDHADRRDDAVGSGINGNGALAPAQIDSIDPLTRQLREMYGAIAEEPIPDTILVLLKRLRH